MYLIYFSPENKPIITLAECEYLIGLSKQKVTIDNDKYALVKLTIQLLIDDMI